MPAYDSFMRCRLRQQAGRMAASFRTNYGEGPSMVIELGNDNGYGWDGYLTVATTQLKDLHTQIGAHLAKLAHEARPQ